MSNKILCVEIERVEPITTAIVKRQASTSELSQVIPAACGVVWNFLRSHAISNPGINVALYLDCVMNIEVGAIVDASFTPEGEVLCSSLPGGQVAKAVYLGPYSGLAQAHNAVRAICAERGLRFAGPSWEIYGHWNDDPSQLQTDVYYLLEEAVPEGR